MCWAVASALLLSGVGGVSLYLMARGWLYGRFDAGLVERVRLLGSTVELEGLDVELGFEELEMGEFESVGGGGYLQVWCEGELLYRSWSLGGGDLDLGVAGGGVSGGRWVALPGGSWGRGVVYRFVVGGGVGEGGVGEGGFGGGERLEVVMFLARGVDEVEAALGALRAGLFGLGVGVAVLMWVVVGYGVGRGLRPVGALAERVGGLDEKSLGERVSGAGVPLELGVFVEQFNGLMGRLEGAFERERRFSGDVAHELRTPLAGMRTMIEVALCKEREAGAYRERLGKLLGIVVQTQEMVESLLRVAALERSEVEVRVEGVRLDEEIRRVWGEVVEEAGGGKRIEVRWGLGVGGEVRADAGLLGVVLRNVLDNAVGYVDEGGVVSVSSGVAGGVVRVRVSNTGSGVRAEDAGRVFDRFWRGDAARSETGVRFGLGLPLVRLAVEKMGGGVGVTSELGGEFVVEVWWGGG